MLAVALAAAAVIMRSPSAAEASHPMAPPQRIQEEGRASARSLPQQPADVASLTLLPTLCDRPVDEAAAGMGDLLSLPEEAFWSEASERRVVHCRGASGRLSDLFPLGRLDPLLTENLTIYSGADEPLRNQRDLTLLRRVERDGAFWTAKWGRENESVPLPILHHGLSRGWTLLVDEMQKRVPSLASLCHSLEAWSGVPCNANLYLTPRGGIGFELHYDWMDIVVLQLIGSKQWKLYPPLYPLPREGLKSKPAPQQVASLPRPLELTLEEGEALYLPRGVLHEAATPRDAVQSMRVALDAEYRSVYPD